MGRSSDWSVLGLSSDPTPGDPERIKRLAERLETFADDAAEALSTIRGMVESDSLATFVGLTADAFKERFEKVPPNLTKLHTSYDLAAAALATYWPKLEDAQRDADRALTDGESAASELATARSALETAVSELEDAEEAAEDPDEDEVRGGVREALRTASSAHEGAEAAVVSAESALTAAKALAGQAKEARESAAEICAASLEEASEAGIQNKKWWQKAVDWVVDNWDTIVAIAKVVVAVLGIVVMIIGGPLAWVVLAAALIVLADTLIDYANGNASLWDVGFAMLDCIPGFKGLTTAAGLVAGARTGLKSIQQGVRGAGRAARKNGREGATLFCRSDPVDMATGQVIMSSRDVTLRAAVPLVVGRYHRTSVLTGRLFGSAWMCPLDQRLVLDESGARFLTDDGMILHYPVPLNDASAPVMPVEGPRWGLTWHGGPGGAMVVHQRSLNRMLRFEPVPGTPGNVLSLTRVADAAGNGWHVEYEGGLPRTLAYGECYRVDVGTRHGRITRLSLVSEEGVEDLVRYEYDRRGDLTEVADHTGVPLVFGYDDRRRLTRWQDRSGNGYSYTYDDEDRCTATRGDGGFLSGGVQYEERGSRTVFTDSTGGRTVYVFNDAYQLISVTDARGNTTRRTWDRYDNPLTVTDPLGRTTSYSYDESGNLTRIVHPDGSMTTGEFDTSGQWTTLVDEDGATWQRRFDAVGNLLERHEPDGARSRYSYDAGGNLRSLERPSGETTHYEYGAAGLVTGVTDSDGSITRMSYDRFGNLASVTAPSGAQTTFRWDASGNLLTERAGDAVSHYAYDAEGNLVRESGPDGRQRLHETGAFATLTATVTPDGGRWRREYDTELRLSAVTNPVGQRWEYHYDAAGNLASENDFTGRETRYEYDAAGTLIRRVFADGGSIEYFHDLRGRVTDTLTTDGQREHFAYSAAGLLLSAENPAARVLLEHDACGRVTAEVTNGYRLERRYSPDGHGTVRTTAAGSVVEWDWAHDRVRSMRVNGRLLQFRHDVDGMETARRVPGGREVVTTRDTLGRVTGCEVRGDGLASSSSSYVYDPAGRLESHRRDATTVAYTYDDAGRPTTVRGPGEQGEFFTYDGAGDLAFRRATSPDGVETRHVKRQHGRPVASSGHFYEYDERGRLITRRARTLSGKSRACRFTWDDHDRLTSFENVEGTRWRYSYDPMGRRIGKEWESPDGTSCGERYTWDGTRLIERRSRGGTLGAEEVTAWTHSDIEAFPLTQNSWRTPAGSPRDVLDDEFFSIVTDLAGAPVELLDEDGRRDHHPDRHLWGERRESARSMVCPIALLGQFDDGESGLHYNVFRYYDPVTTSYLSPDPLGLMGSDRPYGFVFDPLTEADPLGLACVAENLMKRAVQLHGLRSKGSQGYTTTAVIRARTPMGEVDVVAGSGAGLARAQKNALNSNGRPPEVAATNIAGLHAEQNALVEIISNGWTPVAGGASRSVCLDPCKVLINAAGGRVSGNVYPRESGTKIRTFEW